MTSYKSYNTNKVQLQLNEVHTKSRVPLSLLIDLNLIIPGSGFEASFNHFLI